KLDDLACREASTLTGKPIGDAVYELEGLAVVTQRGGPDWLRHQAGERWQHLFCEIVSVDLHDTNTADAHLTILAGLSGLQSLSLESTQVTDEGISHLTSLRRLKVLSLGYTVAGDRSLMTVQKLHCLQVLDLRGTNVSDAGMACLAEMPELAFLWLSQTKV